MFMIEILRVAFQSIAANLFRAVLTMLGIIIGVAAVITMIALGSGARKAIQEQIESLGTNILNVTSGQSFRGGVSRDRLTLTVADARALLDGSAYITAVVPEITGREQIKFDNSNQNVTVTGTTPEYAPVKGFEVAAGNMFSRADDSAKRRVVVLGAEVVENFDMQPAQMIDQTLYIRNFPFRVIGVFEKKGAVGFNNPDNDVWIPLQTAQYRVFGTDRLQLISVQVSDQVNLEKAMVDIERILRREHKIRPGKDNDFTVTDSKMFLNTAEEATRVFSFLLAGIAGVSLLVGGIGIMNIMLVSVTERTREIGIRMALGATRTNILLQFLVESVVLCVAGGLIGIAAGYFASGLLTDLAGWKTFVSPASILLAFLFSAGVGLLFGIWPARRAALLDPVDALRYE